MSNPKDTLNQYAENAAITGGEQAAQHAENTRPDSQLGFFAGKKLKASYVADDENPEEVQKERRAIDERQSVRRIEKLSAVVQDALMNRVQDPGGDKVMRVTHDEFMKMSKDGEFKSFAQYAPLLLNYADGRPRAAPLRPFLKDEVGMYRDKVVVLANNPGDGARTGKLIPVEADIKPEPDPFPSSKRLNEMRLVSKTDDDED